MQNDIDELKAYATRLRADLTATNLVISSIVEALPPDVHVRVLAAVAHLAVHQEQAAERIQTPEAPMQQLQQSIQRHYDHLQGLYKLRADR